MKALVDSIGTRLDGESSGVSTRTRREVDILRRLVNASVAAIRWGNANRDIQIVSFTASVSDIPIG